MTRVRSLKQLKQKSFKSLDELYIDFDEVEKQQSAVIAAIKHVKKRNAYVLLMLLSNNGKNAVAGAETIANSLDKLLAGLRGRENAKDTAIRRLPVQNRR